MTLGSNERLIKVYEYCRTSENQEDSLVLTDRRLVAIHKTQYGVTREEIRVQDVRAINSSWYIRTQRNPIGTIFLLIGLFVAIFPFLIQQIREQQSLLWTIFGIGAGLLLVGLILFLVLVKRDVAVHLHLTTNVVDGHSMAISARHNGILNPEGPHKRPVLVTILLLLIPIIGWIILAVTPRQHAPGEIEVIVDEKSAVNIVEEVGTLIWGLQTMPAMPAPRY